MSTGLIDGGCRAVLGFTIFRADGPFDFGGLMRGVASERCVPLTDK